jgi:preprotein translocase subunit YajC
VFLAEGSGSSGGSGLLNFLPLLLIVAAMYFLLIRPQGKRRREAMELQSRLAPGDEVRTAGGLYGTVVATDDESVTIEAAPGVELRFARAAISTVIAKPVEEEYADDDQDGDDETPESKKKQDSD